MKKAFALLLSILLLLTVVSGCANDAASDGDTSEATASEAPSSSGVPDESEAPEEPGMLEDADGYTSADVLGSLALHGDVPPTRLPLVDEPVTLSWWYPSGTLSDVGMETFNDGEMWKEAEKRTGIHIDWQHPSSTGTQEIFNLMIAGDLLPDLIENKGYYAALGSLDDAVEQGYFTDLVPYIDEYMPHVKGLIDSNPNLNRDLFTDNGYLPGGPGIMQEDNIRVGVSLVVRYDLLESTGYSTEMPVTFQDLHDLLAFFRDSADTPGGLGLDPTGTFEMGGLLLSGLGISPDYMLEDGKVVYCRTTDEYRFYIQTMRDWYEEGLIYKDFYTATSWFEHIQGPMANDEVVVCAMWPAYTADAMGGFAANENFFLKAFKDPVREAGDNKWLAAANTENIRAISNSCTAISTQCKEVELACKYIDYWYSPEGSLLANYGNFEVAEDSPDGTFYYDDTGRPMLTSWMLGQTEEYSLATALTKYAMQLPMYEIVDHVTDGYTDDLKFANKDMMDLYNKDLDRHVNSEGRMPDGAAFTSEESITYSAKYNDILTYIREVSLNMIVGKVELNDTTWNEYVDMVSSLGIDECIDLKQIAVDRYFAK